MSIPTITSTEAAAGDPDAEYRLDVREVSERLAGHAPHSVHIPLGDLPGSVHLLPKDRRIVCICRSGSRSGQAAELLVEQGFDAVNMAGGMKDWSANGYPVVRADGRPGDVI